MQSILQSVTPVQMSSHRHRPLGFLALIGFVASLFVNVASALVIDIDSSFPSVWWLMAAIFLVFIPFVLLNRKALASRAGFTEITANLPWWAVALLVVVFAYGVFNFFLCAYLTGGGNAALVDGEFVLRSHGRILAHLTQVEYHAHKAYELRLFSGGWLFFYAMPAIYSLLGSTGSDDGR
jgi:hypothetical protein